MLETKIHRAFHYRDKVHVVLFKTVLINEQTGKILCVLGYQLWADMNTATPLGRTLKEEFHPKAREQAVQAFNDATKVFYNLNPA